MFDKNIILIKNNNIKNNIIKNIDLNKVIFNI